MNKVKRISALFLSVVLMLTLLVGCGSEDYDYQFSMPDKGDTIAVIHTTMGDITIRFFEKEAPKAVENFVTHAQDGYYDESLFFRVKNEEFIQGGDPTNTGKGGESIWGGTFEDEIVDYLSPYYGAVCMANRGANSATNGSQFFIVTSKSTDTAMLELFNEKAAKAEKVAQEKIDKYKEVGGAMWLDAQIGVLYESNLIYKGSTHTVFGQVLEGMDVAEAIAAAKTYSEVEANDATLDDPDQTEIMVNKPREDIRITGIEIIAYEP